MFILITTLNAQAPQGLNYQATVRNSAGALIINQNVYLKFNIMLNSQNNIPVYSEIHYVPTDDLGQINSVIGQGTASIGTFTGINWANGNYYLGIELNTGSGYIAMGTTQLLSVPYALYANNALQTSTPNLASVLAVNNGANNLQIKNLANPTDTQDAVTSGYMTTQFYTQGQVNNIMGGLQSQINNLQNTNPTYPLGTIHCNLSNPISVVPVLNAVTGKIWMDRNLGASQVATSSTDANAYGDLYQWGRRADGHQCRNSSTTTSLSSTDQPSHGNFIIGSTTVSSDWRNPPNDNLWQGDNGINNPCPSGYRIPTEAELNAERMSWTSNNILGAFASPLKFSLGGSRINSSGLISAVNTSGYYWSSSRVLNTTAARFLSITSGGAGFGGSWQRSTGCAIRCIKN